jgi:hypothetical protein
MKCKFLFIGLVAFLGCKTEEQLPAYLDIKPFEVDAQGGAAWQKITDGWVYVNGEYLGAYTLPAMVPVLAEGENEVIVFPGVKENGIDGTPNIYPYLTRYTKTYPLTGGQTTVVNAVSEYDPNNIYAFGVGRGDFDGGSFIAFENRDGDGVVDAELTSEDAFFGKCLLMQVDTAHPVMDIATEAMTGLPVTGAPEVWLELHYKTDMPFFLSMLSGPQQSNQTIYQFNLSDGWNKIYINLTETLVITQASEQRLFFRLSLPRDGNGKYTQNKGTVRVDNVRVVHF